MTSRPRFVRPVEALYYVDHREQPPVIRRVADALPPLGQKLFWPGVSAATEMKHVLGTTKAHHRPPPTALYDGSLGVGPGEAYTDADDAPRAEPRGTYGIVGVTLTESEWKLVESARGQEPRSAWARRAMLAAAYEAGGQPKKTAGTRKRWAD